MNRTAVLSRSIAVHFAAVVVLTAAATVAGCFNVTAPTGSRDACAMTGGLCVPVGDCQPAGGTSSGDCYVEGVDASECCVGPTPQPAATTCADQGGLCVPIPDCSAGLGYVSIKDADCGGRANTACCLPRETCGGAPTFQCCSQSFILDEPRCDNGTIVCGPLDTRVEFYEASCMR